MTEPVQFTGKNVEAAIAEAEAQLGKSRDDLEIEVQSQGSRGVFGLGGEPARILVRDPSAPPPVEVPAPSPPTRVEWERPQARVARPEPSPSLSEPAPAPERSHAEVGEIAQPAEEIVGAMLTKMGFDAEVSVRSDEDPVTVDVAGDNLGVLIGRRGDSLTALQFMVNVILSKRFHTWPHVVIDVQGYRSRREQSLSSLGQRVADRVRRNRRPFTLEAMPANDRRIIHLALRDRRDVETYSVGEGPTRRVVIAPKR